MLVLAAIPSASVGFVVVSSSTRGLPSGVAAALGIVAGDLVFVAFALLGMTALAEWMGSFFAVLRYLGGAYLIWNGISLIRSVRKSSFVETPVTRVRLMGTFSAAFVLTLGDVKAIVFYASLFPVFIDLQALALSGIVATFGLTALSVGSVKVLYAIFARRIASRFADAKLQKGTRVLAGSALIGAGGLVVTKS